MQFFGSSTFFGIVLPLDGNENWPLPILWPLLSFPNLLTYWVQPYTLSMQYTLNWDFGVLPQVILLISVRLILDDWRCSTLLSSYCLKQVVNKIKIHIRMKYIYIYIYKIFLLYHFHQNGGGIKSRAICLPCLKGIHCAFLVIYHLGNVF